MKKHHILFFILIVVLVPLLLQFLIFNNSFPSNTSNDGWASFFGSYSGAIIGAITTLIAVSLQLNDSISQRKKDEIINIQPYLNFMINSSTTNNDNSTDIDGKIQNIGLHSACNILIHEIDGDHPDKTQTWTPYYSISAGSSVNFKVTFDFTKTVFYKFEYSDLKSNQYEQEFRYDDSSKSFYSLTPKLIRK